MICNRLIQYPKQLTVDNFIEEVETPQCLGAARFFVKNLKTDIDNELVGVKDKFKQIIYEQLVRNLARQFESLVKEQVVPKIHENQPLEIWYQTPVMLDVTDAHSALQFIFRADFDPDNTNNDTWKNISVEIKTINRVEAYK